MKFSATVEKLNKGISIVSRFVGTRVTLPVLNNVLIATEKGRIKLSSTDLEIGITTWITGKVDQDGAITIPSRLLSEFISVNNDPSINAQLKDSTLKLNSEHFEAQINGIDASEFPLIPKLPTTPFTTLSAAEFKQAILQTSFAAALDETRPVLTGVLLRFSGNVLKMVATDSYRLAEKTLKLERKAEKDLDLIIPTRTLNELSRIIDEESDKIQIIVGENQVLFSFANTQLTSRLIEGSFPEYEGIIPKETQTKIKLKTSPFTNAIKMASFFAREVANNIKFKSTESSLQIIATSPQVGENKSEVEAKTSGKKIEISFNAKFLLDVLANITSKEISLEFLSPTSPGIVRPETQKDYLYIIMPLKTD